MLKCIHYCNDFQLSTILLFVARIFHFQTLSLQFATDKNSKLMPVFFVQTIRTAEDSSMELFCLFSYKFQGKCSRSLGQAHSQLFPSFPALHIISSFPLFSFKFSFKLLLLFFYLLSDHKTFLPFQGISS